MKRTRCTKRRQVVSANLLDFYDRCPFRSVIGIAPPSLSEPLADLLPRIAHAIAVFGDRPEPISDGMTADLVASIRTGGSVLLMSDDADLRDHTRREILAMVEMENDGTRRAAANGRAVH